MNKIVSVYTIGIAQAFYALAIPDVGVASIKLVKIEEFSPPGGKRSFYWTEFHLLNLCNALNLSFKTIDLDTLKGAGNLEDKNIYDVSVLIRLSKKADKKTVIAGQVEYVNVMRPSIWRRPSYSLIKRADLLLRIFLPLRIRHFYSLAPKPRKGFYFKESPLSKQKMEDNRKRIIQYLLRKETKEYLFLKTLNELSEQKIAVLVCPLAEHFGGTKEFNRAIIQRASRHTQEVDGIMVIKNHPSDSQNYLKLLEPNCSFEIMSLHNSASRTFPMEILVGVFHEWKYFGVDSTFLVTSDNLANSLPTLFEDTNRRSKKHFHYNVGETRRLFKHEEIFL
jgi:hypothetical protein